MPCCLAPGSACRRVLTMHRDHLNRLALVGLGAAAIIWAARRWFQRSEVARQRTELLASIDKSAPPQTDSLASSTEAHPASSAKAPPVPAPPAAPIPCHILHSGDLAEEIASMLAARRPDLTFQVTPMEKFKKWAGGVGIGSPGPCDLLVVFIVATVENEQAPEAAGPCVRFFNRKSQPSDLLKGVKFTVLGLGDSNLLLDRQTTTAKDCNQIARQLDQRCAALGGERFHALGESDDRTGNLEIEPWLESLRKSLP